MVPLHHTPHQMGGQTPVETRIQMLARVGELSALTGTRVRVTPHDEIVKIAVGPDACSLLVRKYRVREYRYQTCFDAASLVLRVWKRGDTGWVEAEPLVIPDTDFQPYRRQELGEVRNRPEEYRERLQWEASCARPGNGTRLGQRDSFHRLESDSPVGMKRLWAEHETALYSSSTDDEF